MKAGKNAGAYFSALGGKFLAGKKARDNAERNRKRLKEAILVSREFGAQRITDAEIKNFVSRLVYETDRYISAAMETEDAFYEPLVLDALDTARAALGAWKKEENDAASLKHIGIACTREGIVVPGDLKVSDGTESAVRADVRERTLAILKESLNVFLIQNSIHSSGDPDAALAVLAGDSLLPAMGDTGK